MLTKFVVAFSILALVAATAGSIPVKGPSYKVTLSQPVVITGTALKAGEYRLNVNSGTVTFTLDKESHAIPAKVETNSSKYPTDQVRYDKDGDKVKVLDICLGGTKTRLVFN
jgi:lipoprotein-anchoring transpeptidase ErfK/SrfK